MKRALIVVLLLLTYGVSWLGTCTTDANCSLIYDGAIRGGYTLVE